MALTPIHQLILSISSLILASAFGASIPPQTNTLQNQQPATSPCQQYFRTEIGAAPGELKATVLAFTPHNLHGVWAKLFFDRPLKDVTAADGYEVKPSEDRKEFLIKNRNVLLRGGRREILRIDLKYDGDKVPNIMEYRLNGVTVCPDERTSRTDYYLNDLEYSQAKFTQFLETITSRKSPSSEPQYECGVTSSNSKSLFPFQAALYVQTEAAEKYVCEATLISARHLLTAAHCVTFFKSKVKLPSEKLTVHFGHLNVAHEKLGQNGRNWQKASVAQIILYPGYEPVDFLNDLAIVQLATPVEVSLEVQPICLPSTPSETNEVDNLIGYGLNGGVFTEFQSVRVKRVEDCEKLIGNGGLRRLGAVLGDNNYCAQYVSDELCLGDSGSAAISPNSGKWELKGIVSVGTGVYQQKCSTSTPIILIDVYKYNQWINKNVFQSDVV